MLLSVREVKQFRISGPGVEQKSRLTIRSQSPWEQSHLLETWSKWKP